MATIPAYMKKHPCTHCGDGYSECAQGLKFDLQCCASCEHPTRWSEHPPYNKADYLEMWEGKEMPPHVKRALAEMEN